MHDTDQQIDELIQKHERAWRSGYAAFPAVLCKLGLRRGVEVGVAFGGHSGAILEHGGVDKLYGVDSYQHRPGYDDPMNLAQPVFDRLAKRVVTRLAPFGGRFELLREESAHAAERFADGSLDFVYLDADHSEPGVMRDLCTWSVKVREGGVIAGHDYGHRDFPGVKRAVDRFFARFGWQVNQGGHGVWWVERRPLAISFFTPCYNCEAWVQQAADSILHANLGPRDEYLLVDDGSTDATAKRLATLAQHPAVRVIEHRANRGGSAARNTAVHAATHPLCFCLDSDNLLTPGLADAFRRHLLCSDAEVLVPETMRYFKETGDEHNAPPETHRHAYPLGRSGFADYLGGRAKGHAPASGGNLLFTRASFDRAGGFPEGAKALDAWGFGLRLAGTGALIDVVGGTSYWHRAGHASYWARHYRDGSMGRTATDLIQPFLHLIHASDRRYMTGPGRGRWYFERSTRRFRTAPPHRPRQRLSLRAGLARLSQCLRTAHREDAAPDTARLRLVLGVGRSGTTWTLKTLAQCDDALNAYSEPLHHLRPAIHVSPSSDRVACDFSPRLGDRHPIIRAYQTLSAQRAPGFNNASRVMVRGCDQPDRVLIKEVHALLATPALLNATNARAVVILRNPLRVIDSIFDCQGLDAPYLHHEFEACGDTRLLAAIGNPDQTTQRLEQWRLIRAMPDARQRRVYSAAWAVAVTQVLLKQTAEQVPDRVLAIRYEQAKQQPQAVFGGAATHLGLRFGDKAAAFVEQSRSRDESNDPYSVFRAADQSAHWRVLTAAQRDGVWDVLDRSGLLDHAHAPADGAAAEPVQRSA